MRYNLNNSENGKSIKELPPADRPRERLGLNGAESLSDLELICILLGSGIKGRPVQALARSIVECIDQQRVSVRELSGIPGLGEAKASTVCAALELGRRLNFSSHRFMKCPGDVYPLIRHYADRDQEHFLTVSLNGAHEVVAVRLVTMGLVNQTVIHPREVFCDVLKDRAIAVVLAHNHPSGSLSPSPEDVSVTREMVEAGRILGIRVLDHMIITRDGYYSMLEQDCFPFD